MVGFLDKILKNGVFFLKNNPKIGVFLVVSGGL